ncbi:MAG: hypothetical protein ACOWW1_02605 [archaeon]
MRRSKKVIGIPKQKFIIGIIIAAIIGAAGSIAVISLLNINFGSTIPKNTTISVTDVDINVEDAETFSLTVLNPTYSPTKATIKQIIVITQDDEVHNILSLSPQLPFELNQGKEQTFSCDWTWGDYIGETANIVVVVEDGSGAVYELEAVAVGLEIKQSSFSGSDTEHFKLYIENPEESEVDFTITKIVVTLKENGTELDMRETTPSLPTTVSKNSTSTITCEWDWGDYRDKDITITAYTSQGYQFSEERSTPKRSQILVTDVKFDTTSLQTFDITVENSEYSIDPATIVAIEVTTDTTITVPVTSPQALPYDIAIGDSVTMTCTWDWSATREQNIFITVETSEGFIGYSYETTK